LFSENQFCSLSVWDLLRLTPSVLCSEYFTRPSSLCLLSFRWDLRPRFVPQDWQWIFYWSLQGLKGRFVCVWNCWIFFVGEYSTVWPEICRIFPKFSADSYVEFQEKTNSGEFLEIFWKPRLSSTKTCEISPYFLHFLFWIHIALKKFTQVFPYLVCTQVRRHVQKRITKRRYGKKIQDVLFSANQFWSLLVWDLLRLTP